MRQATDGGRAPAKTTILSSAALVGLLAGCQTGPLAGVGDATRAAPVSGSVQLIERDVEAPEVFSAEDSALWDGRPSLGGVWVAAPGVREPERVIIRNSDNGKFVIGALFKRERSNPGPALQLSSDAAVALGILAGSPTTIDVVALRREEVSEPTAAPAAVAPLTQSETAPLDEEIVEATAEPEADAITSAAAALDALDEGPDAVADEAVDTVAVAAVAADAAPEPRRRNFFGRLFNRNRDEAPAPMPAAATAPVAPGDVPPEEPIAANAAPVDVTATTLEPVRTASAAPAPVAASGLDRAFVQIGIFSVEENANNTATALSNAGVLPTVLAEESQGRKFWRVVVGPSTTAADRTAIIRKAKDLGFADAFAVRG